MNDFNALNLPSLLLKAIHDSGYPQPTPFRPRPFRRPWPARTCCFPPRPAAVKRRPS